MYRYVGFATATLSFHFADSYTHYTISLYKKAFSRRKYYVYYPQHVSMARKRRQKSVCSKNCHLCLNAPALGSIISYLLCYIQGCRANRDRKESSSHPRLSLRLSFNFPNLFHIYAKLISFIIMLQPKNLSSRANVDTQHGTHFTAPANIK